MKIGNITMSGTWDLKDVAMIMRKHKEGSLKLTDALWELIQLSK